MTDSPVRLRRFAIPPGPTTDPTLQDVIAHRLRRFPNLTDVQIAGLVQTLDPNVVEAVSDSVLAQMVAGTLPTQPLQPGGGMPLGLPGAQTLARFAGGTDTGAPTTGTFHQGDFVVTADGHIFVCTAAGSPGTWVDAALAGIVTSPDATASVKGLLKLTGDLGGTASSPTVPGLASKAPLASPALTGTPTAPTATPGTATTQVATTAFTAAAVAAQSGTTVSPPTTFTTETAPDGGLRIKTETSGGKTITYTYDDANGGRISAESDGTTTRTYSYDATTGVLTGIA